MQNSGFDYTRVLNNIKRSVNVSVCSLRDTVNSFSNPTLKSIWFVDKDLIYATTNNEKYQLHLQWDGLGVYSETSLVTKAPSKGPSSIRNLENHIFLVRDTVILKYSLPGRFFGEILSEQDTRFQP